MRKRHSVLVTGASGYIASWIIKYLLEQGHEVHATVRDLSRTSSYTHLRDMAENATGVLKLFSANLLDRGSFDEAMHGCDVVIHTASPFLLEGYLDPYEALVRPAVAGTWNVLDSANRCESVRRIVLTSSIGAIAGDNADLSPGKAAFDDSDWNFSSSQAHNPYQFSKTMAELEAWRMARTQDRWKLVVVNPGMVYGPSLASDRLSASMDSLLQMGDGRLRTGAPDLRYGVVDVRDVARAHLLAGFDEDAHGRYILVAQDISMLEIAGILRCNFGSEWPFPRFKVPKLIAWLVAPLKGGGTRHFIARNVGYPASFNNMRSLALGVRYRSFEKTITENFRQLVDGGWLNGRKELIENAERRS